MKKNAPKTELDIFIENNKQLISDVLRLNEEVARKTAALKKMKDTLSNNMEKSGINRLSENDMHILFYPPTSYSKLDTNRFKADFPLLYDKYSNPVYKESFIVVRRKAGSPYAKKH